MTDTAQSAVPDVLYDDSVRLARLPGTRSETAPQLLQRMGGQYWDDVRSTMNRWFDHVPPAERKKLKGKLLGKDRRQFPSAFWELFLHETFIRAGYDVVVEGEAPESERRPDFRITKGAETWYVEARLADSAADSNYDPTLRSEEPDNTSFCVAVTTACKRLPLSLGKAYGRGAEAPRPRVLRWTQIRT